MKRISGTLLGKFAGPLMEVAVPLTKNVLVPLATMTSAFTIDGTYQGKFHGQEVMCVGKEPH